MQINADQRNSIKSVISLKKFAIATAGQVLGQTVDLTADQTVGQTVSQTVTVLNHGFAPLSYTDFCVW